MTRRVWLPFRALILASFKIERVKNGLVSLKEKIHGEEKTSCRVEKGHLPMTIKFLLRRVQPEWAWKNDRAAAVSMVA